MTKVFSIHRPGGRYDGDVCADLSDGQIKALLKSKTPLADICKEWNKTETHHMDDARDMIEARANAVIRAEREKGQREER